MNKADFTICMDRLVSVENDLYELTFALLSSKCNSLVQRSEELRDKAFQLGVEIYALRTHTAPK